MKKKVLKTIKLVNDELLSIVNFCKKKNGNFLMIHITHDMYVLSNEQVYRLCTFNLYISYILQITSCGQKDTDSTCGTRIAVS